MRAAEEVGVDKVYYTAVPRSLMRMGRELASALGLDAEELFSENDIELIGTDDAMITTQIDCVAFIDHKFRALQAHRTQLGTTQWYLEIPEEFRVGLANESYVLARSSVAPPNEIETDLFERVDT